MLSWCALSGEPYTEFLIAFKNVTLKSTVMCIPHLDKLKAPLITLCKGRYINQIYHIISYHIYRYVMDVVVERCYAARENRSPSPFSRLLCEADSSLYCRSISSDGRELWLRERLGCLLTVLLRRRILYSSALYGDTFSFQSMHTI